MKKELEILIQALRIYRQDIGMDFRKEKLAMQIKKSGKQKMTEGTDLPNVERNKNAQSKENLQIFGNVEADTIKQVEVERKKKERIP